MLVNFSFTDATGSKLRPAMVLFNTGDADVVVAPITSRIHNTPYDVAISDWQGAGLRLPSVVPLHKLTTVERSIIQRHLGERQQADRNHVASVLKVECRRFRLLLVL